MSGPFISDNGDVISSALNHSMGYADANQDHRESFGLLPGQIISIYTVDNAQNVPDGKGTFTMYDVQISHPDGASEVIRRCQMLQPGFGGGMVNYCEIVPNDPGPKATKPNVAPALKRGSMVLIGFVSGQKLRPIILGCLPHPAPVAVETRPKKADGTVLDLEFQGLNVNINNDGELLISFSGPKTDKGKPVDEKIGPTEVTIDKKGNFKIATNEEQSVEIDRVKKKITVTNGEVEIVLDQEKKKVTVSCDDIEVSGEKSITFISKKVNLGEKAPSHKVGLADMIEKRLKKIESSLQTFVTDYTSHMHPTTAPGAPTLPPMIPTSPFMADSSVIGSDTVKVSE